ncbi:MarR family winged helix-turn-helix transcriptional regulator [Streptomyces sp. NPDC058374]|uniref:MarR family winged helix-turn-helix transcriptional regulator n=1 Tax=unclassified Streptomyces TaxID=2593676 RepID=UPI0036541095
MGVDDGSPGEADAEFLALERELSLLFRRARAGQAELARAVHPQLEPAAYGLLVRLIEGGPQRATDLAAYMGVGKATISRQLGGLEELGLIDRAVDPGDRRASLLRVTPLGAERVAAVSAARRGVYVRRLADWDRRDVGELARLLRQLNGVLTEGK